MHLLTRILKEPLLHFVLIGAALFVAYDLVSIPGERGDNREIVITQTQIDLLADSFTQTWQRPPTTDELEGLIRSQIREEVFYREAIAMGLDRDDVVIRRRLQQKLEFISSDLTADTTTTDAELSAYLQAHPDMFREDETFSFRQVYLNPEKHPDLQRDVEQLLAQLNNARIKIDPASSGDATMLEHAFVNIRRGDVSKLFGETLASQLDTLEPGRWQGPVESGYGVHLVFISERIDGHVPELNEIRESVQREWAHAQRLAANAQFYQSLLKHYTVSIENHSLNAHAATKTAQ